MLNSRMQDEVYDEGIEADLLAEDTLTAQGKPVQRTAQHGIAVMNERLDYFQRQKDALSRSYLAGNDIHAEQLNQRIDLARHQLAKYQKIYDQRN